jgi:hypothetical protein
MSFWEKGYNAAFTTSFYRNPFQHTADDSIEKVNREFLLRVARAIMLTTLVLANES